MLRATSNLTRRLLTTHTSSALPPTPANRSRVPLDMLLNHDDDDEGGPSKRLAPEADTEAEVEENQTESGSPRKYGTVVNGVYVNAKTGERGGPRGPEPTRYNDWEHKGRCSDF